MVCRKPGGVDVYKRQDFVEVLPQITYSLQSLEFFHHTEKALLVARGVLPEVIVRDATLTVGPDDQAHIKFLSLIHI